MGKKKGEQPYLEIPGGVNNKRVAIRWEGPMNRWVLYRWTKTENKKSGAVTWDWGNAAYCVDLNHLADLALREVGENATTAREFIEAIRSEHAALRKTLAELCGRLSNEL